MTLTSARFAPSSPNTLHQPRRRQDGGSVNQKSDFLAVKRIALLFPFVLICFLGCSEETNTSEDHGVSADDLAKALNLQFCEIIVPDSVREALRNKEARIYLLVESSAGSWDFSGPEEAGLEDGENIRFFGNRYTQEVSFITNRMWGTNYRGREDLEYSWFPSGKVELEDFSFGFIDHPLHRSPPRYWVGDTIPKWFDKEGVPPGSKMNWIKYRLIVSNAIPEEVPEALKRRILSLDSRAGIHHD